jgi:beta-galactosidase
VSETTFQVAVRVAPQAPVPETGFLNLGHYPHPQRELRVNSRYLQLDGRPWMPVMGEFHYSRTPASEWATELAKLRAGGVEVVASYVIWNHHEPRQGHWRWDGQRDLARFVALAAEAGLLVYLRPGPWVHAEVRLGGFPEWLPATGPLRCNDAVYLGHVQRLFEQVAAQIKGQLWCDGGPVIGLQLENEYGATGPGCGAEHISELKRLAIDAGMTVPIYTVTGWPTLDIPPREVLPVSGAYADGFWQGSREALPPSGVFLFNTRRVIGEMGNVDGTPAAGLIDTAHYPFCLAEAGGGMHQSYHRRPVVTADDVYATTLVQLGSGANLYGYYMYHGGTNPVCATGPLNETQASGYPNDVPQWGYDFHAPLGQYGQVRASWGRLRCLHQFMQAFGEELAPLEAALPEQGPFDPADRALPRVAVRAAGADADTLQGFVFVNHHVRHHPLPALAAQQFSLQPQAGAALQLPLHAGVNLRPGTAFIWPVGQRFGSARLRQATVQPLTRWTEADGSLFWVGFAPDGVATELVFDAEGLASIEVDSGSVSRLADGARLLKLRASDLPSLVRLRDAQGRQHQVLLLSQAAAAQAVRVRLGGRERLLWASHAATWNEAEGSVTVHRPAHEEGWLRLFPAEGLGGERENLALDWACWQWAAEPLALWALQPELLKPAGTPPVLQWGPHIPWRDGPVPLVPDEAAHAAAARWALRLPVSVHAAMQGDTRLWLSLDLVGDVARFLVDGRVVDDRFCDGSAWQIALDRWCAAGTVGTVGIGPELELSLLPLPEDLPVFLEERARAAGTGAHLRGATLSLEKRETVAVLAARS